MTIPLWLIAAVLGLGVGAGGVVGVQALTRPADPAETVAEVATVVEQVEREDVTEAETRQAVATMPAVNIAVEAAVDPEADAATRALAAYALCLAAAQGKTEGSAAFGCQARGVSLDKALAPAPVSGWDGSASP